jgi:S-adenosylmethionine:tRNA ribosyltransferase-isomerase
LRELFLYDALCLSSPGGFFTLQQSNATVPNSIVLKITDYTYDLPLERIALYPLQKRDESKLLIYNKGVLSHAVFKQVTEFLPKNSFLFFNDTKVIPARLYFKKDTGAEIEIFLLTPLKPSPLHAVTMAAKNASSWECTIGNLKRWNEGLTLVREIPGSILHANLVNREKGIVAFSWTGDLSFAEVITQTGETPLPPYIKRQAEPTDKDRYQTIYSHYEGAVAAPTAGLHFTEYVFAELKKKNIDHDFLTLHVSAGTFQPVKEENVHQHVMHREQIIVSRKNLSNILSNEFIVPVGTTSMRTLESIYWFGVKLLMNQGLDFIIEQEFPYQKEIGIARKVAIQKVIDYMKANKIETLVGETSIFIKPGYRFRVCNAIITNFHQPASTLILLIASFVGNDWKKIYAEALKNEYRFLSYGDSSLLIP